ncbi:uncharacterized protein JCM15063_006235 [Sporobolomyces koalae]|uniref:uncharacterized protein n=1 Tax=Sporobolomyces koalae TaxID=500713 RepID=UPI003173F219
MEEPQLRQRYSTRVPSQADAPVTHLESTFPAFVPPSYTIKELLGVIPPHCFDRSALRSSLYVLGDLVLMITLGLGIAFFDHKLSFEHQMYKWIGWSTYWIVQSWVMTGIWVLGHECGHQAFSTSKTVNNAVGIVLHSFLLVPYHSWRISHARHHAATGHMDRDQVFVPRLLSQRRPDEQKQNDEKRTHFRDGVELEELLEDAPLYKLVTLVGQQLLGWPLYLIMNASGQKSYPAWTNHFNPSSIIFDRRHRISVLMSDIALIITLVLMTLFTNVFWNGSLTEFIKYYGIPYLLVNHWLVMITFLQHTDSRLPHYRQPEWTFVRGALCTIDRQFLGPVGTWLLHGIAETHTLHHVCSKIPHYHADEATVALSTYLSKTGQYHWTNENVFRSLWRSYSECRFVDIQGDIVMYRDAFGRCRRAIDLSRSGVCSDSGVDLKIPQEMLEEEDEEE